VLRSPSDHLGGGEPDQTNAFDELHCCSGALFNRFLVCRMGKRPDFLRPQQQGGDRKENDPNHISSEQKGAVAI